MDTKSNQRKNQAKNQKKIYQLSKTNGSTVNLLSNQEIAKRAEQITKDLKSYTWRELETKGKFDKNKKLNFISDEMLILGCNIGSETHFIRGIDSRGRDLSKKAPFPKDIVTLGVSGIKEIWHEVKLRGRCYSRAEEIVRLAGISVGI